MENGRPKVGIGVLIFKDGKVLLGKRKLANGAEEYWPPGGHLESMESFEQCALRETEEETGLVIKNVRFLLLRNQKEYAPKHYINIGMVGDWVDGKPEVREKEIMKSWDWYDLENLPSPLMESMSDYIEAYKTGKNFFDK